MHKRSGIRSETIIALLFAAIPLAFMAGVVLFQMLKYVPDAQEARAETLLSFMTVRSTSDVDQAVQDAERGQRGFLITGQDQYLQPYIEAKDRLPQLIIDLQSEVRGSPEQEHRVLKLQADVTTKMNELATTIATMRAQGYEAARNIVLTDLGRKSMEAITADLTEIMDAANQRLARRLALAGDAEERVTQTFVITSILAALALVVGAFLLARSGRRAAISEQDLQATLDSVREGVGAFDARGRLRAWNSSFVDMLGLAQDDLQRWAALPQGHGESGVLVDRIRELAATMQATGHPGLAEHHGARGRSIEIFHNPGMDGDYVATVLDITERRKAEEAVRQAQKLDSMGRMTGGVAHDFNNFLTVIIGSLELLQRAIGRDEKARERIDMMRVAADRASRLTKQLLAFARRQPLQADIVNLGPVVQALLPLVRRAVGEEVLVECVIAGGLWNATVDSSEFQSAVLNLAINGRDAMPNGGKLTLELGNTALDDAYAALHAEVEPGQYVMFAVTDTGKGMDPVTMEHALDPFFTTKPPGEGTGLGLPQVYGFVKQSGGHLKIYSETGEGTTVKLYLPRNIAQETIQPPPAVVALAVTGSETVLLVDDDEIVRATVATMLEDLGYIVLQAGGGAAALAVLKEGGNVDLLLTDVVMPGPIGGRQLAEQALAFDPRLKVLFTSGYTENAIVHHGRLDPGVELLSKPYGRDQLAAKVRRVLDSGPRDHAGSGRSWPKTGNL
jgi:signal transduction histidine kinase/ActR/RegA family two-component response regulator